MVQKQMVAKVVPWFHLAKESTIAILFLIHLKPLYRLGGGHLANIDVYLKGTLNLNSLH